MKLDAHAPSSVLRTVFGGLLDFSPVKRADSEAMLKARSPVYPDGTAICGMNTAGALAPPGASR